MLTHTPESTQAIESRHREITHRLMVDWNNNGDYDHPLSDMSQYVTRTSRDHALDSTTPSEIKLVEGYAAAALDVTIAGEYDGFPMSGQFAPYNSRSVFYVEGLQLGVSMTYEIGVCTDAGWEWFPQFVGMVREINTDRDTGDVVLSCLDNSERMRSPLLIPPYATYRDYLINGFKRSGLVDSSSVIDLAARSAGFSNSPQGYKWVADMSATDGITYNDRIVLSVPFHGSMLPEVGALDNEFEFHLTETWENGTDPQRARKEQYREGPDFAGNGKPYLALNAVPQGENAHMTKKYWMDTHEFIEPEAGWFTTVIGTWIYWTGSGVDQDSRVAVAEYYNVQLDLNVRSSDRGVYPILRTGKTTPGGTHNATYTGPLMYLPEEPGWNYIEVSLNISGNNTQPTLMKTRINDNVSSTNSHNFFMTGSAPYALQGLVTLENKYALSDFFVFRTASRSFLTSTFMYDFESRANVNADWGRNRVTYTLRDDSQESWEVVKDVSAAEFGVVFFDETGNFNFWNYDTVEAKQSADPVRVFSMDQVENLSLRLTMDSVRNVWRVTTKTAEAAPGVAFDMARDGVPRQFADRTLPLDFVMPQGVYTRFYIPDNPNVISTHPYVDKTPSNVDFDSYAPWNGYKTFQGVTYTDRSLTFYPHKSSPHWTYVVGWNGNGTGTEGFVSGQQKAYFRLQGTLVNENEERSFEVRNDTSVAAYGQRVIEMSNNFWLQDRYQTEAMLNKLVSKLGRPIPVTDAITVPGDPRIQIGDVIEIRDPEGFGGAMRLQILGITRNLEDGVGLRDTYQVEVIENPGVGIWDDPDYGLWDTSFIWS